MKGYKGFYPGLICEPDSEHKKQYAENTVYEEDKAKPCKSGMHFCKYPLGVFAYYPPVTDKGVSEYAEVEAMDEPVTDDEIKFCSKRLKIGARIGIPALVQASVEYIKNNIVETKKRECHGQLLCRNEHGLLLCRNEHRLLLCRNEHGLPVSRNEHGLLLCRNEHRLPVSRKC